MLVLVLVLFFSLTSFFVTLIQKFSENIELPPNLFVNFLDVTRKNFLIRRDD